jgi:hypothetical protein
MEALKVFAVVFSLLLCEACIGLCVEAIPRLLLYFHFSAVRYVHVAT